MGITLIRKDCLEKVWRFSGAAALLGAAGGERRGWRKCRAGLSESPPRCFRKAQRGGEEELFVAPGARRIEQEETAETEAYEQDASDIFRHAFWRGIGAGTSRGKAYPVSQNVRTVRRAFGGRGSDISASTSSGISPFL